MVTLSELRLYFADEFHDWIDGDDPVLDCRRIDSDKLWVQFESGAEFLITFQEVYE